MLRLIKRDIDKAASRGECKVDIYVDIPKSWQDSSRLDDVVDELRQCLWFAGFEDATAYVTEDDEYGFLGLEWADPSQKSQYHGEIRTGLVGKCCICYDEYASILTFVPCGHVACNECEPSNFVGDECPVCRQNVTAVQGVFLN